MEDARSLSIEKMLNEFGIFRHDENKPLYKYTSIDTAFSILDNETFRYSSPSIFNDPFEFNRKCIDITCTQELMEINLKQLLPRYKPDIQDVEAYIKTIKLNEYVDRYVSTLEEQRVKSLVQCYSERNNSVLMWSHYANNHRGVCIGIKVPTFDKQDSSVITLKVNYTRKITPISIFKNPIERGLALAYWTFTKSDVWAYEQEVRTSIDNTDERYKAVDGLYGFLPFDKANIVSLTFGVNTSQEDIEKILSLVHRKRYTDIIQVSKMKIGDAYFDLEEERIA